LKEADFIPHIFSSNNNRHLVIEYAFQMPQPPLLNMFSVPKRAFNYAAHWKFSGNFSREVWIGIFVFFLVCGLLNWANMVSVSVEKYASTSEFVLNFVDQFGLLVGQGIYLFLYIKIKFF